MKKARTLGCPDPETPDLCFTISGKYLADYEKWFMARKDRELTSAREVIEEMAGDEKETRVFADKNLK